MLIDYTSDTHFDFYIHESKLVNTARVKAMLSKYWKFDYKKRGDLLIIAGDLGHYNKQNIDILKIIKSELGYKHIITTLGNHERYLVSKAQRNKYKHRSENRILELKNMFEDEEHLHLLDGNVIEIEGIKFGGACGCADGSFSNQSIEETQEDFKVMMNDGEKITKEYNGYDGTFNYFFKSEYQKLEKIADQVNIMVTHFVPLPELLDNEPYAKEYLLQNNFYCFNGEELIKNTTAKYWFFGHKHQRLESGKHGVKLLSSPMGYRDERYIQNVNQIIYN